MNKYFFILCFFTCLFMTSCKVMNTVSIDYLKPADFSFPPQVKNVAVVNNLSYSTKDDSRQQASAKQTENDIPGITDGNGKVAAEQLAESLADGNYFDRIIICDSALRKKDHFQRENKLSQNEVKELSNDLGADMILSIEELKIYTKKDLIYSPEYMNYIGTIDAIVGIFMRAYLPSRKEPVMSISDCDSIYWMTDNPKLTDDLIDEASTFAAFLPTKHILPTWQTVNRPYYAGGAIEFRDAEVAIRENDWEEALRLWKRISDNSTGDKLKMRAAFNTGIYYELKDSLDQAKESVKEALKIAEKKIKKTPNGKIESSSEDYDLIALYLAELERRTEEMNKLRLQMSRFNDEF